MQFSGDREIWDRKANRVELFGHAVVKQPGEVITADYIVLDQNARTLDARGNCVYVAAETVITSEELHFNLETRTGTVVNGRVSNERFSLAGERINRLGEGRYQTHWGEYSTCRDCTQSWTLQAQDVDMQVEGYAYLSNVAVKIKDTPSLWIPYLIIPMKTRRQSGVLFPTLLFGTNNGAMLVLPYYWAINRSSDMTFGLGYYTAKGPRLEWEGRYALSGRSVGLARYFYLSDSTFTTPDPNSSDPTIQNLALFNPNRDRARWGLDIAQTQELPLGIDEKLRIREVSDNLYPYKFGDIPAGNEQTLSSTASLAYSSPGVNANVAARRIRNLLDVNLDPVVGARAFDPTTVQLMPAATVTTNDHFLFGTPIATGFSVGLANFTRGASFYDVDPGQGSGNPYVPGVFNGGYDPIRTGARFSASPSAYTTFRPWDLFALTPSLRYNGYFYNFGNNVPNLYRGYLLFQTDLSAQLERIYDTGNPDQPRTKHLIRPTLTYSGIPKLLVTQDENHPFIRQIAYGQSYSTTQGAPRYYWDSYDIIPFDSPRSDINNYNNYYVPQGNSIAAGFTTQLIDRYGRVDSAAEPSYLQRLEFSAGQAFNLLPETQHPLTRFYSTLNLNLNNRFTSSTSHFYYPDAPNIKHEISNTNTYIFERGMRQGILTFDRSLAFGVSWHQVSCTFSSLCGSGEIATTLNYSINDYILPSYTMSYNFVTQFMNSERLGLLFQSPSRCWRFNFGVNYDHTNLFSFNINLEINYMGVGFGGATSVVDQIASTYTR